MKVKKIIYSLLIVTCFGGAGHRVSDSGVVFCVADGCAEGSFPLKDE